jgi:hypothetical protein
VLDADGGPDFYDHKTLLEDPPTEDVPHGRTRAVGMKFALVDTTIENGAIQIVPGTHKMEDYGFDRHDYNRLLLDGDFHGVVAQEQPQVAAGTPMHHVLKKGDVWIQDPRIFHRGTANMSDSPRPEFQISYRSKKSPSPYRGLFVRRLPSALFDTQLNLSVALGVYPFLVHSSRVVALKSAAAAAAAAAPGHPHSLSVYRFARSSEGLAVLCWLCCGGWICVIAHA